jgi:hypothetical protein
MKPFQKHFKLLSIDDFVRAEKFKKEQENKGYSVRVSLVADGCIIFVS